MRGHFDRARWNELRSFFLDFPWSASCFSNRDASMVAESVSRFIVARRESCIPPSIKSSNYAKWFNRSCSIAAGQRDDVHRTWRQNPNPTLHKNFISTRNRTKGKSEGSSMLSSNKNVRTFLIRITPKYFGPSLRVFQVIFLIL